LAIIGDDLTGAMDSSGHFARLGYSTTVLLDPGLTADSDVVAVTTNSRAETPVNACQRVRLAVRGLANRIIFKKIDSTLRGNIGEELNSVIEELGSEKAIVAPAFPAMGRTTVKGVLLVDGVEVAKTQFADDPVIPVRESHIPALIERSTGHRVACLPLKDIEAGPEFLYKRISSLPQRIVVCDVTAQSHLASIARAANFAGTRWLLCGSTGLAREMHVFFGKTVSSRASHPAEPRKGQSIVVVGSRHHVSAEQLRDAGERIGLTILDLETTLLSQESGRSQEVHRISSRAKGVLEQGKSVAITSTFSFYFSEMKRSVPAFMAEIVERLYDDRRISGLFLSGGDIALEVCRRLGISTISVMGEVEPGVPAGEAILGDAKRVRIVTKAGGFGSNEAIALSLNFLEKGEFL
jgi:uncharacterized protein YgbK (DUF1537 family)